MTHDLNQAKVFDVNGEKYRVGLDDYGFVQIQHGEVVTDGEIGAVGFYVYDKGRQLPYEIQFDPETARAVAEYIENLAA